MRHSLPVEPSILKKEGCSIANRIDATHGLMLQKVIPACSIESLDRKKIGWHTFRHTYSTLLTANQQGSYQAVIGKTMSHSDVFPTRRILSKLFDRAIPRHSDDSMTLETTRRPHKIETKYKLNKKIVSTGEFYSFINLEK
jgi:hypothetical protein